MAEWLKAPTLKAGVEITTEGSNPSLSLKISNKLKNHFKHKKKQTVKREILIALHTIDLGFIFVLIRIKMKTKSI